MYNWLPFPFLRIVFAFVLGIITGIYLPELFPLAVVGWLFTAIALVLGLIYFFKSKYFYSLNLTIGTATFILMFIIGHVLVQVKTPSNFSKHLVNQDKEVKAYLVTALGNSSEREKTHRVLAEITKIKTTEGWSEHSAKLYLYLQKDSLFEGIEYGDQMLVLGSPDKLNPPKNPFEFDYKRYISHQGIYYSDYVPFSDWKLIGNAPPSLVIMYSNKLRSYFEQIIRESIDSSREKAIALALVLGVKDEIDGDISQAYASAGAMHVLAVSGLHVGVVFWVVALLFGSFKKKPKWKWVYLLTTLIVLWGYAFVTGLSSSVLRAVTMFSFVTLGTVSNRQSNIYNTLALSAFVLLCYNPFMVMSVGFQLSFMAVFGIVYMQPKIYGWFVVDNYFLDKVWAITSVSVAAQIATAPLVVLYFHQLPTYFFISNLVVIPGAFVILCSGLLLLATYELSLLGDLIGKALEFIIYLVNEVVFYIHTIPFNTFDNIYITTVQAWCILFIILGILALFYFRRVAIAVLVLLPVLAFSAQNFQRNVDNLNQKKIVFYSINNELAIDFVEGHSAQLVASEALKKDSEKLKFHIAPSRLAWGIPLDYDLLAEGKSTLSIAKENGIEFIIWNGISIAIVQDSFKGNDEPIVVDYLYLLKPDNKMLKESSNTFEYHKLVVNGNSKYLRFDELGIPQAIIHPLQPKGALVVDID